jgi:hypothetical protein
MKSIEDSTPATASTPASWPAPDGSSTTGTAALDLLSEHFRRQLHRWNHVVRVFQSELGDEPVEALLVRGSRIDHQPNPTRNHVRGARLNVQLPYGRHHSFEPGGDLAHPQHVLGRRPSASVRASIGVVPAWSARPSNRREV